MYNVYVLEEGMEMPDDDICYVVSGDGIFLKKKLDLVDSLTKVDKISILPEVKSYARLNIPKLTGIKFAKVIGFLSEVYEEHSAEGCILLFYNQKNKRFKLEVPEQTVSGASVNYEPMSIDDYELIGTIHSHANFGAFHSGTDTDDEESFDGLHITVGHIADSKNEYSMSACVVINGERFKINPTDYVKDLEIVKREKFGYSNYQPASSYHSQFHEKDKPKKKKKKRKNKNKKVEDKKEYDYRFKLASKIPKSARKIPKEWMEQVSGSYTYQKNYTTPYGEWKNNVWFPKEKTSDKKTGNNNLTKSNTYNYSTKYGQWKDGKWHPREDAKASKKPSRDPKGEWDYKKKTWKKKITEEDWKEEFRKQNPKFVQGSVYGYTEDDWGDEGGVKEYYGDFYKYSREDKEPPRIGENDIKNNFRLDEEKRGMDVTNPCEKCIHKDLKINLEVEEINEISDEIDSEIQDIMVAIKEMYPDLTDEEAYQAAITSQAMDEGIYY